MRRILITLAILIVCIAAVSATWIFRGRQLSLFIDRFDTIETASARINSIAYEGSGTGGLLHINDLARGLNDKNGPTPNIGTTKDNQLGLAAGGKVFAFGPPRSEAENLAAVPPAGDDAFMERSQLANAARSEFYDRPFAVMETASLLPAYLEEAFRRKLRNALALRTIFLSRKRLGKRLHDS
jgi:hypothetical protein